MRRTNRSMLLLLSLAGLLAASLACSLPGSSGDGGEPSGGQGSQGGNDLGGSDLEALQAVVNPDELDGYRSSMVITSEDADGNPLSSMTILTAWNKADQARSIRVQDQDGNVLMEQITIGADSWMRTPMMGDAWITIPPGSEESTAAQFGGEDLDLESTLADQDTDVSYLGSENVRDFHCRHYRLESTLTSSAVDPTSGQEVTTTTHSVSELWIADQSDLPEVLVRMVSDSETTRGTDPTEYTNTTIDFNDLNVEVEIQAPR